jgi:hypothetical protein
MTTVSATTAAPALRDPDAEAAYVAAVIRDPGWLRRYRLEPDAITSHEPRAAYDALVFLTTDCPVTTIEAVAVASGIAARVIESFPFDADVPALVRRLQDLNDRRRLHLAGEAAIAYALESKSDPVESAFRVSELLKAIMTAVPIVLTGGAGMPVVDAARAADRCDLDGRIGCYRDRGRWMRHSEGDLETALKLEDDGQVIELVGARPSTRVGHVTYTPVRDGRGGAPTPEAVGPDPGGLGRPARGREELGCPVGAGRDGDSGDGCAVASHDGGECQCR